MRISDSFTYEGIEGFRFGYRPVGTPQMFVHIYYVDGLLIDTGQRKMAQAVFNTISKLPVAQIYITHHHEDHTGNLKALQNHFDCPAYSSKQCTQLMQDPPKISFAQKVLWGNRPGTDKLIIREDTIETDKYRFKIIPIPGHAEDMVALYEPNKRWLFSADLYVNYYISYFLYNESTIGQINSIRKVLDLDFDVLLCAHNPQLKSGKEKLEKKLKFLEGFYHKVAQCYDGEKSALQIFKELNFKEKWPVRIMSGGSLSKLNMVKSVIRDLENKK